MKTRKLLQRIILLCLISLIPGMAFGQAPAAYFVDNFENGLGNWTVSGQEWGLTTSSYHSAGNSITDSPAGDYANNANSIITLTQAVDLSAATAPVLSFWHKLSVDNSSDKAIVEISDDGGYTWFSLVEYTYSKANWSHVQLDLTPYKSVPLKIRFRLTSNSYNPYDGWYIDDVEIREKDTATLSFPFFDNFENGIGNWIVSGQDWDLTTAAFHSSGYAATESPSGNYSPYAYAVMTLAKVIDLTGTSSPVLSFWNKFYLGSGGKANVEISKDGGITWASLYEWTGSRADWTLSTFDLTSHKAAQVKIRFRLSADFSTAGDGWYVDDIEIREKDTTTFPFPFSDNFENGLGNWIVSGQDWDMTTSSYHSAGQAVTDSPAGNYDDYANAVLQLAKSVNLSSTTFPMLTFWHKHISESSDKLRVQISKNGGFDWSTIAEYYGTLSTWTSVQLDLSPHKSSEFQLRFAVTSDSSTSYDGWTIDDVAVKEWDTPPFAPTGVKASPGSEKMTLQWDNMVTATSYNLYWSTSSAFTRSQGTKIANVTSPYVHTGLTNDTTYYYLMTAVNPFGESANSTKVSATPKSTYIPPPAPTTITPTSGDGRVTISWSAVSGASSYNLYWSTSAGVTKTTGMKIANVSSGYAHTGLTNFTAYYYILTSLNSYGESEASVVLSSTPLGLPPAPGGVTADAGNGQTTISWDSVNGADYYNLYYGTDPGITPANGTRIFNVTSPYTHTGLDNLTYYYVVTAVNGLYGESVISGEATAISQGPPFAPAQVQATDNGNGQITITWGSVVNATSYNLYWSESPGVTPTTGTKISVDANSYTHTGLTNLTRYYYAIAAVNTYGESALSPEASEMPTSATITIKFGQVALGNIDANGQINNYKFYGVAGDKVILSTSHESGSFFYPNIRLYGPDGSKICEATGSNSHQETTCTLPLSGSYTVTVYEYGGDDTGSYSLYVQRLNNPGNATAIAFGQAPGGTIASGAEAGTFVFTASADDKVILSASNESGSFFYPNIRLYGPDGGKICEATGSNYHQETTCTLPVSGSYTVTVYAYGGNSTGSYSLSSNCLAGICGGTTTFDIIATAGVNGTIVPSGLVTLSVGGSQTFTILANANCHIADVIVDGKSVGPLESYTFSNLSANHTIQASFEGTRQMMEVIVNGSQPQMTVGGVPQTLTATARYSDRSTEAIAQPAWTSLNESVATVSAEGIVTAIAAGSTSITASYGGLAGKFDITVGAVQAKQHQGNLILVAGGGVARDNTLKDSTEYLADLVYTRFRSRMFSDADIYFFSPKSWHDLDGDGFRDNIVDDDYPIVTNFSLAITSWAAGQNSDGPLYIYLIDHGGVGQFVLFPGQILTAAQLKSDLDAFQNATGRQVVVVIEACKSGTFTDILTINPATQQRIGNRIVITSANQLDSYLDLSGRISFTQFFVDRLFTGDSVYQSYLKTKQKLANLGLPYSLMQPQLAEETIHPSMNNYVGGAFVIASIFPEFSGQSPNMVIDVWTTPTFYATLSSLEGIESVWAVVTPPDYVAPSTSADFTAPQVNLPRFSLSDPDGDGKYEGAYNQFTKNGDYVITFYARNRSGHLTASAPTRVTVQGALEMGDLNGDNAVNLADAILALQIMAGKHPVGPAKMVPADVNNDGKINLQEAVYILQKAAGMR